MAARSKARVCSRSPAEIVGSNPAGGMDVCSVCCLLSGRGLCDELITRPEESYRQWYVVVCDLETSRRRDHGRRWVAEPQEKKENGRQTDVARKFYSSWIHYIIVQQLVSVLGILKIWLQY